MFPSYTRIHGYLYSTSPVPQHHKFLGIYVSNDEQHYIVFAFNVCVRVCHVFKVVHAERDSAWAGARRVCEGRVVRGCDKCMAVPKRHAAVRIQMRDTHLCLAVAAPRSLAGWSPPASWHAALVRQPSNAAAPRRLCRNQQREGPCMPKPIEPRPHLQGQVWCH